MNKMKITHLICILGLVITLAPRTGFSQAGTLDDSFGDNGIAMFAPTSSHESANDMIMLEDSSMIICGSAIFSSSFDGFLMHILSDGTQDMSFGTNGIVQIDYGDETYAYSLELDPDGKIVVSGMTYTVIPDAEFFIARYLPNGTPDASFNSTGYFISSYGADEEYCLAMAMQPDGKFVLAGRTYAGNFSQLLFMRVNTNGTLDASFGTNGYTEIDASIQDEEIEALALLNDGHIIGVGYGYQGNPMWGEQVFMAKLTANGQPAAGFGTNGVMVPAIFNDISTAYDVTVHNDSVYITGQMWDVNNNVQMFLAKLDANGNAYTNFGTNGITFFNLNVANYGLGLVKTNDNKIYVCGTTGLGGIGNRDFLIARYLPSGILDNSFNSTGYTVTPIRPDWDEASALAIAPNGKVVLAGLTSGFSTGNNDIAMTRYLNDYIPSGCVANFTADSELICEGSQVQFTDLTYSTDSVVVSWAWTFEGGTPATSNVQNPLVTYSNDGVYDVRLAVYDGIYYDTLLVEGFISVEATPEIPATPAGPADLCNGYTGVYSTSSVPYAGEYSWQVTPSSAGTISGTTTTATFTASATWTGTATIQVRAEGYCGNSSWSPGLQVEVYHNPEQFQMVGDGAFCEGSPGAEIAIDGSETGVNYELYFAGNPTGNIMAGDGSPISFGFFTTVGLYSVYGYTDHCAEFMVGQVYVHELPLPEQAFMPVGPEQVCDHDSSTYVTTQVDDADVYIWTLSPGDAGEMTIVFDTVHIAWNPGFTGKAFLSVHGENLCGAGPESDDLEIDVYLDPEPAISGPQLVCDNTPEMYETANNTGSFYTWEVTGGEVTAGPGTHQVTILWGDPGMGTVTVTEETADGCSTTTESFEVTIEECIYIDESSTGNMRIYPNPVEDMLFMNIYTKDITKLTISIYSISGEVVYEEEVTTGSDENSYQYNVARLGAGLYMLRVTTGKGLMFTGKFVKN